MASSGALPPVYHFANGTRQQLFLGEVEPVLARVLALAEQQRTHVVAVEDHRFALTVIFGQFDAREPGAGGHQVQAAGDLVGL